MNVQEELERMLFDHLYKPDAQKATEAMRESAGSKTTVELTNGRVFNFEPPFNLSISTPQNIGEPDQELIDFTCSGESESDQEKIRKAYADAVKQHWVTFTIVTARSLYLIHRWNIAGSMRFA